MQFIDATEENKPTSLPVLRRDPNGWEGQGENFNVHLSIIKIKTTDGNPSYVPSEEQRLRTMDEDGIFSQYVQLPSSDSTFQLWMRKIGPYLADWVLGKRRYGTFIARPFLLHSGVPTLSIDSPEWRLLKFPKGYTLWLHKKGVETDPANPRTDAYLFGAPHLGPPNRTQGAPTIFRSPMEFVEHAIWLMKGREGQCLCKYCMPGQNQKAINRRLNHGLATDSDPESDDDDETGPGTSNRQRDSASRRKGASARANRGRRGGRRDRSPPILAKDYRVGNSGAGPAA
jgi:Transcription-silencing protein, cryptic loci regulator Clr2